MVGALHAIATETGWDPGEADILLGTSAGSMIGALVGSALPPWLLMAYGAGEDLGEHERSAGSAAGHFGTGLRLHWSFPRPVLGSPGLALRSMREPWKYGPAGIIAWLPQGVVSTEPLKSAVRRVVPSGWSSHPNLWITAIDYETGARVVFGRQGAPRADLADAVAASCAVPGFYHPVTIRGRKYVDGGMYSPANLDLIAGTEAQLVVCLNPVSSRFRGGLLEPTGRIAAFLRGDNRRLIDREALLLERAGKQVIVLEPNADDLHVMGFNYMSRKHLDRVMETAVKSTKAALRGTEPGRVLSMLPAGRPDRLRRPGGSPANWPADLFPPVRRSAQRQETGCRNTW
jgi:NTE family protein